MAPPKVGYLDRCTKKVLHFERKVLDLDQFHKFIGGYADHKKLAYDLRMSSLDNPDVLLERLKAKGIIKEKFCDQITDINNIETYMLSKKIEKNNFLEIASTLGIKAKAIDNYFGDYTQLAKGIRNGFFTAGLWLKEESKAGCHALGRGVKSAAEAVCLYDGKEDKVNMKMVYWLMGTGAATALTIIFATNPATLLIGLGLNGLSLISHKYSHLPPSSRFGNFYRFYSNSITPGVFVADGFWAGTLAHNSTLYLGNLTSLAGPFVTTAFLGLLTATFLYAVCKQAGAMQRSRGQHVEPGEKWHMRSLMGFATASVFSETHYLAARVILFTAVSGFLLANGFLAGGLIALTLPVGAFLLTAGYRAEKLSFYSRCVKKEDFADIGDAETIWQALLADGYIDKEGKVTRKFDDLKKPEEIKADWTKLDVEKEVKKSVLNILLRLVSLLTVPKELFNNFSNKEAVWNKLIEAGFIDRNGVLTGDFIALKDDQEAQNAIAQSEELKKAFDLLLGFFNSLDLRSINGRATLCRDDLFITSEEIRNTIWNSLLLNGYIEENGAIATKITNLVYNTPFSTPKELFENFSNKEVVWNKLIEAGFIDRNGVLTRDFIALNDNQEARDAIAQSEELKKTFDLLCGFFERSILKESPLNATPDAVKKEIFKVLQKAAHNSDHMDHRKIYTPLYGLGAGLAVSLALAPVFGLAPFLIYATFAGSTGMLFGSELHGIFHSINTNLGFIASLKTSYIDPLGKNEAEELLEKSSVWAVNPSTGMHEYSYGILFSILVNRRAQTSFACMFDLIPALKDPRDNHAEQKKYLDWVKEKQKSVFDKIKNEIKGENKIKNEIKGGNKLEDYRQFIQNLEELARYYENDLRNEINQKIKTDEEKIAKDPSAIKHFDVYLDVPEYRDAAFAELSRRASEFRKLASGLKTKLAKNNFEVSEKDSADKFFKRVFNKLCLCYDPDYVTITPMARKGLAGDERKVRKVENVASALLFRGLTMYKAWFKEEKDPVPMEEWIYGKWARVKNPAFDYLAKKGNAALKYIWVNSDAVLTVTQKSYLENLSTSTAFAAANNQPTTNEGFMPGTEAMTIKINGREISFAAGEYFYNAEESRVPSIEKLAVREKAKTTGEINAPQNEIELDDACAISRQRGGKELKCYISTRHEALFQKDFASLELDKNFTEPAAMNFDAYMYTTMMDKNDVQTTSTTLLSALVAREIKNVFAHLLFKQPIKSRMVFKDPYQLKTIDQSYGIQIIDANIELINPENGQIIPFQTDRGAVQAGYGKADWLTLTRAKVTVKDKKVVDFSLIYFEIDKATEKDKETTVTLPSDAWPQYLDRLGLNLEENRTIELQLNNFVTTPHREGDTSWLKIHYTDGTIGFARTPDGERPMLFNKDLNQTRGTPGARPSYYDIDICQEEGNIIISNIKVPQGAGFFIARGWDNDLKEGDRITSVDTTGQNIGGMLGKAKTYQNNTDGTTTITEKEIALPTLEKAFRLNRHEHIEAAIEIVQSTKDKNHLLTVIERRLDAKGLSEDRSKYIYTLNKKAARLVEDQITDIASITDVRVEKDQVIITYGDNESLILGGKDLLDNDKKNLLSNRSARMQSTDDIYQCHKENKPFYTPETDRYKPRIDEYKGRLRLVVHKVDRYDIKTPDSVTLPDRPDSDFKIFPAAADAFVSVEKKVFFSTDTKIIVELQSQGLIETAVSNNGGFSLTSRGEALLEENRGAEQMLYHELRQQILIPEIEKLRNNPELKLEELLSQTQEKMDEFEKTFDNIWNKLDTDIYSEGNELVLEGALKVNQTLILKEALEKNIITQKKQIPITLERPLDPELLTSIDFKYSKIIQGQVKSALGPQQRFAEPGNISTDYPRDPYFYGLNIFVLFEALENWGQYFGINRGKGVKDLRAIESGRTHTMPYSLLHNEFADLMETNGEYYLKLSNFAKEIWGAGVSEDTQQEMTYWLKGIRMWAVKEMVAIMVAEKEWGRYDTQNTKRYNYSEVLFDLSFLLAKCDILEKRLGGKTPLMKFGEICEIAAGKTWYKVPIAKLIEMAAIPSYLLSGAHVLCYPVDYNYFLGSWAARTVFSSVNYSQHLLTLGYGFKTGFWKNPALELTFLHGYYKAAMEQFLYRNQYATFMSTVGGTGAGVPPAYKNIVERMFQVYGASIAGSELLAFSSGLSDIGVFPFAAAAVPVGINTLYNAKTTAGKIAGGTGALAGLVASSLLLYSFVFKNPLKLALAANLTFGIYAAALQWKALDEINNINKPTPFYATLEPELNAKEFKEMLVGQKAINLLLQLKKEGYLRKDAVLNITNKISREDASSLFTGVISSETSSRLAEKLKGKRSFGDIEKILAHEKDKISSVLSILLINGYISIPNQKLKKGVAQTFKFTEDGVKLDNKKITGFAKEHKGEISLENIKNSLTGIEENCAEIWNGLGSKGILIDSKFNKTDFEDGTFEKKNTIKPKIIKGDAFPFPVKDLTQSILASKTRSAFNIAMPEDYALFTAIRDEKTAPGAFEPGLEGLVAKKEALKEILIKLGAMDKNGKIIQGTHFKNRLISHRVLNLYRKLEMDICLESIDILKAEDRFREKEFATLQEAVYLYTGITSKHKITEEILPANLTDEGKKSWYVDKLNGILEAYDFSFAGFGGASAEEITRLNRREMGKPCQTREAERIFLELIKETRNHMVIDTAQAAYRHYGLKIGKAKT